MNKRLITAKILIAIIFGVTLVSHQAYDDGSGIELLLEILALLLLGISAFGRTWASFFITGKKNTSLVVDGPYSIVRNPLYFFSFVGFIGVGLAFGSLMLAAAYVAVFFLTHWPTIMAEEKFLNDVYKETFDDYKNKVPRFFPNPVLLKFPESIEVTPVIFSKALYESSTILLVIVVADIVEWLHISNILPVMLHLY